MFQQIVDTFCRLFKKVQPGMLHIYRAITFSQLKNKLLFLTALLGIVAIGISRFTIFDSTDSATINGTDSQLQTPQISTASRHLQQFKQTLRNTPLAVADQWLKFVNISIADVRAAENHCPPNLEGDILEIPNTVDGLVQLFDQNPNLKGFEIARIQLDDIQTSCVNQLFTNYFFIFKMAGEEGAISEDTPDSRTITHLKRNRIVFQSGYNVNGPEITDPDDYYRYLDKLQRHYTEGDAYYIFNNTEDPFRGYLYPTDTDSGTKMQWYGLKNYSNSDANKINLADLRGLMLSAIYLARNKSLLRNLFIEMTQDFQSIEENSLCSNDTVIKESKDETLPLRCKAYEIWVEGNNRCKLPLNFAMNCEINKYNPATSDPVYKLNQAFSLWLQAQQFGTKCASNIDTTFEVNRDDAVEDNNKCALFLKDSKEQKQCAANYGKSILRKYQIVNGEETNIKSYSPINLLIESTNVESVSKLLEDLIDNRVNNYYTQINPSTGALINKSSLTKYNDTFIKIFNEFESKMFNESGITTLLASKEVIDFVKAELKISYVEEWLKSDGWVKNVEWDQNDPTKSKISYIIVTNAEKQEKVAKTESEIYNTTLKEVLPDSKAPNADKTYNQKWDDWLSKFDSETLKDTKEKEEKQEFAHKITRILTKMPKTAYIATIMEMLANKMDQNGEERETGPIYYPWYVIKNGNFSLLETSRYNADQLKVIKQTIDNNFFPTTTINSTTIQSIALHLAYNVKQKISKSQRNTTRYSTYKAGDIRYYQQLPDLYADNIYNSESELIEGAQLPSNMAPANCEDYCDKEGTNAFFQTGGKSGFSIPIFIGRSRYKNCKRRKCSDPSVINILWEQHLGNAIPKSMFVALGIAKWDNNGKFILEDGYKIIVSDDGVKLQILTCEGPGTNVYTPSEQLQASCYNLVAKLIYNNRDEHIQDIIPYYNNPSLAISNNAAAFHCLPHKCPSNIGDILQVKNGYSSSDGANVSYFLLFNPAEVNCTECKKNIFSGSISNANFTKELTRMDLDSSSKAISSNALKINKSNLDNLVKTLPDNFYNNSTRKTYLKFLIEHPLYIVQDTILQKEIFPVRISSTDFSSVYPDAEMVNAQLATNYCNGSGYPKYIKDLLKTNLRDGNNYIKNNLFISLNRTSMSDSISIVPECNDKMTDEEKVYAGCEGYSSNGTVLAQAMNLCKWNGIVATKYDNSSDAICNNYASEAPQRSCTSRTGTCPEDPETEEEKAFRTDTSLSGWARRACVEKDLIVADNFLPEGDYLKWLNREHYSKDNKLISGEFTWGTKGYPFKMYSEASEPLGFCVAFYDVNRTQLNYDYYYFSQFFSRFKETGLELMSQDFGESGTFYGFYRPLPTYNLVGGYNLVSANEESTRTSNPYTITPEGYELWKHYLTDIIDDSRYGAASENFSENYENRNYNGNGYLTFVLEQINNKSFKEQSKNAEAIDDFLSTYGLDSFHEVAKQQFPKEWRILPVQCYNAIQKSYSTEDLSKCSCSATGSYYDATKKEIVLEYGDETAKRCALCDIDACKDFIPATDIREITKRIPSTAFSNYYLAVGSQYKQFSMQTLMEAFSFNDYKDYKNNSLDYDSSKEVNCDFADGRVIGEGLDNSNTNRRICTNRASGNQRTFIRVSSFRWIAGIYISILQQKMNELIKSSLKPSARSPLYSTGRAAGDTSDGGISEVEYFNRRFIRTISDKGIEESDAEKVKQIKKLAALKCLIDEKAVYGFRRVDDSDWNHWILCRVAYKSYYYPIISEPNFITCTNNITKNHTFLTDLGLTENDASLLQAQKELSAKPPVLNYAGFGNSTREGCGDVLFSDWQNDVWMYVNRRSCAKREGAYKVLMTEVWDVYRVDKEAKVSDGLQDCLNEGEDGNLSRSFIDGIAGCGERDPWPDRGWERLSMDKTIRSCPIMGWRTDKATKVCHFRTDGGTTDEEKEANLKKRNTRIAEEKSKFLNWATKQYIDGLNELKKVEANKLDEKEISNLLRKRVIESWITRCTNKGINLIPEQVYELVEVTADTNSTNFNCHDRALVGYKPINDDGSQNTKIKGLWFENTHKVRTYSFGATHDGIYAADEGWPLVNTFNSNLNPYRAYAFVADDRRYKNFHSTRPKLRSTSGGVLCGVVHDEEYNDWQEADSVHCKFIPSDTDDTDSSQPTFVEKRVKDSVCRSIYYNGLINFLTPDIKYSHLNALRTLQEEGALHRFNFEAIKSSSEAATAAKAYKYNTDSRYFIFGEPTYTALDDNSINYSVIVCERGILNHDESDLYNKLRAKYGYDENEQCVKIKPECKEFYTDSECRDSCIRSVDCWSDENCRWEYERDKASISSSGQAGLFNGQLKSVDSSNINIRHSQYNIAGCRELKFQRVKLTENSKSIDIDTQGNSTAMIKTQAEGHQNEVCLYIKTHNNSEFILPIDADASGIYGNDSTSTTNRINKMCQLQEQGGMIREQSDLDGRVNAEMDKCRAAQGKGYITIEGSFKPERICFKPNVLNPIPNIFWLRVQYSQNYPLYETPQIKINSLNLQNLDYFSPALDLSVSGSTQSISVAFDRLKRVLNTGDSLNGLGTVSIKMSDLNPSITDDSTVTVAFKLNKEVDEREGPQLCIKIGEYNTDLESIDYKNIQCVSRQLPALEQIMLLTMQPMSGENKATMGVLIYDSIEQKIAADQARINAIGAKRSSNIFRKEYNNDFSKYPKVNTWSIASINGASKVLEPVTVSRDPGKVTPKLDDKNPINNDVISLIPKMINDQCSNLFEQYLTTDSNNFDIYNNFLKSQIFGESKETNSDMIINISAPSQQAKYSCLKRAGFTPKEINTRYGVFPEDCLDFAAFKGGNKSYMRIDSSDNTKRVLRFEDNDGICVVEEPASEFGKKVCKFLRGGFNGKGILKLGLHDVVYRYGSFYYLLAGKIECIKLSELLNKNSKLTEEQINQYYCLEIDDQATSEMVEAIRCPCMEVDQNYQLANRTDLFVSDSISLRELGLCHDNKFSTEVCSVNEVVDSTKGIYSIKQSGDLRSMVPVAVRKNTLVEGECKRGSNYTLIPNKITVNNQEILVDTVFLKCMSSNFLSPIAGSATCMPKFCAANGSSLNLAAMEDYVNFPKFRGNQELIKKAYEANQNAVWAEDAKVDKTHNFIDTVCNYGCIGISSDSEFTECVQACGIYADPTHPRIVEATSCAQGYGPSSYQDEDGNTIYTYPIAGCDYLGNWLTKDQLKHRLGEEIYTSNINNKCTRLYCPGVTESNTAESEKNQSNFISAKNADGTWKYDVLERYGYAKWPSTAASLYRKTPDIDINLTINDCLEGFYPSNTTYKNGRVSLAYAVPPRASCRSDGNWSTIANPCGPIGFSCSNAWEAEVGICVTCKADGLSGLQYGYVDNWGEFTEEGGAFKNNEEAYSVKCEAGYRGGVIARCVPDLSTSGASGKWEIITNRCEKADNTDLTGKTATASGLHTQYGLSWANSSVKSNGFSMTLTGIWGESGDDFCKLKKGGQYVPLAGRPVKPNFMEHAYFNRITDARLRNITAQFKDNNFVADNYCAAIDQSTVLNLDSNTKNAILKVEQANVNGHIIRNNTGIAYGELELTDTTGKALQIKLPSNTYMDVVLEGAGTDGRINGYGAKVTGEAILQKAEDIYLLVGGKTTGLKGGWNGGGDSVLPSKNKLNNIEFNGWGGAGASEIRIGGKSLEHRQIIAGGAGGGFSPVNPLQRNDRRYVAYSGHGGYSPVDTTRGTARGGTTNGNCTFCRLSTSILSTTINGVGGKANRQDSAGQLDLADPYHVLMRPAGRGFGGGAIQQQPIVAVAGGGGGWYGGSAGVNGSGGGGGSSYINPRLFFSRSSSTTNSNTFSRASSTTGRIKIKWLPANEYACFSKDIKIPGVTLTKQYYSLGERVENSDYFCGRLNNSTMYFMRNWNDNSELKYSFGKIDIADYSEPGVSKQKQRYRRGKRTFTDPSSIGKIILPKNSLRIIIEVWGADGGNYKYLDANNEEVTNSGGIGGYTKGIINNATTQRSYEFYVFVGGKGGNWNQDEFTFTTDTNPVHGRNGGGKVKNTNTNKQYRMGGGASDVRYQLSSNDSIISSLSKRVLVAGGGGGAWKDKDGGYGGGGNGSLKDSQADERGNGHGLSNLLHGGIVTANQQYNQNFGYGSNGEGYSDRLGNKTINYQGGAGGGGWFGGGDQGGGGSGFCLESLGGIAFFSNCSNSMSGKTLNEQTGADKRSSNNNGNGRVVVCWDTLDSSATNCDKYLEVDPSGCDPGELSESRAGSNNYAYQNIYQVIGAEGFSSMTNGEFLVADSEGGGFHEVGTNKKWVPNGGYAGLPCWNPNTWINHPNGDSRIHGIYVYCNNGTWEGNDSDGNAYNYNLRCKAQAGCLELEENTDDKSTSGATKADVLDIDISKTTWSRERALVQLWGGKGHGGANKCKGGRNSPNSDCGKRGPGGPGGYLKLIYNNPPKDGLKLEFDGAGAGGYGGRYNDNSTASAGARGGKYAALLDGSKPVAAAGGGGGGAGSYGHDTSEGLYDTKDAIYWCHGGTGGIDVTAETHWLARLRQGGDASYGKDHGGSWNLFGDEYGLSSMGCTAGKGHPGHDGGECYAKSGYSSKMMGGRGGAGNDNDTCGGKYTNSAGGGGGGGGGGGWEGGGGGEGGGAGTQEFGLKCSDFEAPGGGGTGGASGYDTTNTSIVSNSVFSLPGASTGDAFARICFGPKDLFPYTFCSNHLNNTRIMGENGVLTVCATTYDGTELELYALSCKINKTSTYLGLYRAGDSVQCPSNCDSCSVNGLSRLSNGNSFGGGNVVLINKNEASSDLHAISLTVVAAASNNYDLPPVANGSRGYGFLPFTYFNYFPASDIDKRMFLSEVKTLIVGGSGGSARHRNTRNVSCSFTFNTTAHNKGGAGGAGRTTISTFYVAPGMPIEFSAVVGEGGWGADSAYRTKNALGGGGGGGTRSGTWRHDGGGGGGGTFILRSTNYPIAISGGGGGAAWGWNSDATWGTPGKGGAPGEPATEGYPNEQRWTNSTVGLLAPDVTRCWNLEARRSPFSGQQMYNGGSLIFGGCNATVLDGAGKCIDCGNVGKHYQGGNAINDRHSEMGGGGGGGWYGGASGVYGNESGGKEEGGPGVDGSGGGGGSGYKDSNYVTATEAITNNYLYHILSYPDGIVVWCYGEHQNCSAEYNDEPIRRALGYRHRDFCMNLGK